MMFTRFCIYVCISKKILKIYIFTCAGFRTKLTEFISKWVKLKLDRIQT